MIPKSELKHGEYYWGDCRNANTARWNAEKNVFVYNRTRMDQEVLQEEINHPEDDDGSDLFIPEELVTWGTDFIPL